MQYKEVKGKLGIGGRVIRALFWGWQALMLYWFVSYTFAVAPVIEASEAAKAVAGMGIGLSWTGVFFFWLSGTAILGLVVLVTRPARIVVLTRTVE